jgi:hypothetical protein
MISGVPTERKETTVWLWGFRVTLSVIGILSLIDGPRVLRYALLGILVAILVAESLWNRRARRLRRSPKPL